MENVTGTNFMQIFGIIFIMIALYAYQNKDSVNMNNLHFIDYLFAIFVVLGSGMILVGTIIEVFQILYLFL